MLHVVNTIKRILRTAWVNSRYALFHRNTSKIFCIGFNKTGTTSLYHALLREGLKVGDQPTAERLLASYVDGDFDPIVEYCKTARAFQDVPFSMPNTYRHLYHAFPDAKFILSVREEVSLANLGADFGILGNEPVAFGGKGRTYGVEFQAQQAFVQQ
jgi:hypothetical protein